MASDYLGKTCIRCGCNIKEFETCTYQSIVTKIKYAPLCYSCLKTVTLSLAQPYCLKCNSLFLKGEKPNWVDGKGPYCKSCEAIIQITKMALFLDKKLCKSYQCKCPPKKCESCGKFAHLYVFHNKMYCKQCYKEIVERIR